MAHKQASNDDGAVGVATRPVTQPGVGGPATPLDTEHPGLRTVARAHLEQDGRVLLHRHYLINEKGEERMMIELRMTRK